MGIFAKKKKADALYSKRKIPEVCDFGYTGRSHKPDVSFFRKADRFDEPPL
jgi:hypothetical protein